MDIDNTVEGIDLEHLVNEPYKQVIDYDLIDKQLEHWGSHNNFDSNKYNRKIDRLVDLKKEQNITISLAIPTLNEAKTVGKVIRTVKPLRDRYKLLDEIIVVDSDSTDNTKDVALKAGANDFYLSSEQPVKREGIYKGKGENLWTSLYVSKGDLIFWIDADIQNISPRFVYGLVGPLLERKDLLFIKGYYERPPDFIFHDHKKSHYPTGGGRVTELVVRNMINDLFPYLSLIPQPLSGEYGGRRELLDQLPFYTGYAVEIGLLIEIQRNYGLETIGVVDLKKRIHRPQDTYSLAPMAAGIRKAIFEKAQKYGRLAMKIDLYDVLRRPETEFGTLRLSHTRLDQIERRPMITKRLYLEKFPERKKAYYELLKKQSV